ncbi:MAG: transcriptional repressor LexA [Gemmiger qucibialis]|nr:transcriptional repressor LexA [Gemmiger qucibialis]
MKKQRGVIMADFASTIKRLRTERGVTQEQLAAMLNVSRSTIGMYETGSREPDFETCEAIADIFNVDMDYLIGRSPVERKKVVIPPGFQPMPEMSAVPLVGSIACGTPILAEQNIEARIGVPALWRADFALTCHGNSMAAMIQDGDIVCIRKQPEVENGEIAAVRIGEEATLKRFYRQGDTVMLQAENPAFSPLVYTRDQLNEITIEGRVVGICRGI